MIKKLNNERELLSKLIYEKRDKFTKVANVVISDIRSIYEGNNIFFIELKNEESKKTKFTVYITEEFGIEVGHASGDVFYWYFIEMQNIVETWYEKIFQKTIVSLSKELLSKGAKS